MTPVEEVVVRPLKRQYPHVDNIEDWRAQQSVRLLWDRVFALEARLQAVEATLTRLVEASNTQEAQLARIAEKVDQALAESQLSRSEAAAAAAEGSKDDHGLGALGCAAAGATGDIGVLDPTELTLENVGKIICGTANEYPALFVGVATQAERDANRDEFMERVVWHLGQAGFAAGRYGTPEGRPWHVLFDALAVDGTGPLRQQGYRTTTYDDADLMVPIEVCTVYGGQSVGTTTTPETGTPD